MGVSWYLHFKFKKYILKNILEKCNRQNYILLIHTIWYSYLNFSTCIMQITRKVELYVSYWLLLKNSIFQLRGNSWNSQWQDVSTSLKRIFHEFQANNFTSQENKIFSQNIEFFFIVITCSVKRSLTAKHSYLFFICGRFLNC